MEEREGVKACVDVGDVRIKEDEQVAGCGV